MSERTVRSQMRRMYTIGRSCSPCRFVVRSRKYARGLGIPSCEELWRAHRWTKLFFGGSVRGSVRPSGRVRPALAGPVAHRPRQAQARGLSC